MISFNEVQVTLVVPSSESVLCLQQLMSQLKEEQLHFKRLFRTRHRRALRLTILSSHDYLSALNNLLMVHSAIVTNKTVENNNMEGVVADCAALCAKYETEKSKI